MLGIFTIRIACREPVKWRRSVESEPGLILQYRIGGNGSARIEDKSTSLSFSSSTSPMRILQSRRQVQNEIAKYTADAHHVSLDQVESQRHFLDALVRAEDSLLGVGQHDI